MPGYIHATQSEFRFQEEKDVILLVGSHAKLANCFITALENEFPNCDVVYCKDLQNIEQLRLSTIKSVILVIVHHALNAYNISQINHLKKTFSTQPVALAYDNTAASSDYVKTYGEHFDSHLPMEVKLDVWLSIIRLILSGGKYVSPELLKAHYQKLKTPCNILADGNTHISIEPENDMLTKTELNSNSCLSKLTQREIDVIRLMASGLQNKVIAASLDLSEHTVKLHIHHIISKLNVSNRTEATAVFLNADRFGEERC